MPRRFMLPEDDHNVKLNSYDIRLLINAAKAKDSYLELLQKDVPVTSLEYEAIRKIRVHLGDAVKKLEEAE